jgi:hypothetical protein
MGTVHGEFLVPFGPAHRRHELWVFGRARRARKRGRPRTPNAGARFGDPCGIQGPRFMGSFLSPWRMHWDHEPMEGLRRPQNAILRYSCDTADYKSALRRNVSWKVPSSLADLLTDAMNLGSSDAHGAHESGGGPAALAGGHQNAGARFGCPRGRLVTSSPTGNETGFVTKLETIV